MLNISSLSHTQIHIHHLVLVLPHVMPPSVPCWITPSIFTSCKSSRQALIGAICNLKVIFAAYACVRECVQACLCVFSHVCIDVWFVPAQCWDSISVHNICSTQGLHSRTERIICAEHHRDDAVQHSHTHTHTVLFWGFARPNSFLTNCGTSFILVLQC